MCLIPSLSSSLPPSQANLLTSTTLFTCSKFHKIAYNITNKNLSPDTPHSRSFSNWPQSTFPVLFPSAFLRNILSEKMSYSEAHKQPLQIREIKSHAAFIEIKDRLLTLRITIRDQLKGNPHLATALF